MGHRNSMAHWHQHAFGFLADGSRVMTVTIKGDLLGKRAFPAVLVCRPAGLYRLWRSGRSRLLAPGFTWPVDNRYETEYCLRPHVPKAWGSQHGSQCVIQPIPPRLLTDGPCLARRLCAWVRTERAARTEHALRDYVEIGGAAALPVATTWRPAVLTTVPCTDIVVHAVDSGVLARRLARGLERIYVSEMAWLRVPRLEATLRALAQQFPARLALVKAERYENIAKIMGLGAYPRAAEYQFIGNQLFDQYAEDFGYDKHDNPNALDDFTRLRVGDIPRHLRMLWMRELPLTLAAWDGLDEAGVQGLVRQAGVERAAQVQRGMQVLAQTLDSKS